MFTETEAVVLSVLNYGILSFVLYAQIGMLFWPKRINSIVREVGWEAIKPGKRKGEYALFAFIAGCAIGGLYLIYSKQVLLGSSLFAFFIWDKLMSIYLSTSKAAEQIKRAETYTLGYESREMAKRFRDEIIRIEQQYRQKE